MGRKPTRNKNLPRGLRARHRGRATYYFLDTGALDRIEPINIRQYLKWRSAAKVRANREKALFSHINYARETGLTNKPNPCAGVRGDKETGRDTYIDDAVLDAVWEAAEAPLRDALDLAYLTGQRPADVLKASSDDIQDGALKIQQNKGGKRLRIQITGPLGELIERMRQRPGMGSSLLNNDKGQPYTKSMLRGAFDRARAAAIVKHPELAAAIKAFQFRDLRAKAGTDKEESSGIIAAQDQLGHSSSTMTAHYVRHRRGKLVLPTK